MSLIKIIIGSTRPGRFGPKVANWLNELAQKRTDAQFELVDIADLNLPFLDESTPPAFGKYENDHTRRWAAAVGEADAFLIVTPEYNYGVSGALKNAIDFVGPEWANKPVAFASYGGPAGGARAVAHLREICGNLRLFDIRESLVFVNYWAQLGANGEFVPAEEQVGFAHAMLDQLVFWADQLKRSRTELAKRQEVLAGTAE